MTVPPPLFISSRLMAALTIEGVGTVHVLATGLEGRRIAYDCVIEDVEGTELYAGNGIRSGVDYDIDYLKAIETTLHFIAHDGECFARTMGAEEPHDGWLYNPTVAEWAYMNAEEIDRAAYELEHPEGFPT